MNHQAKWYKGGFVLRDFGAEEPNVLAHRGWLDWVGAVMFNHDCFVGKLLVEMGCFIVSLKFNGIETESIRTGVDQSDRPGVEIRTIMNRETDTGEKILIKNPFQLACIFSFLRSNSMIRWSSPLSKNASRVFWSW